MLPRRPDPTLPEADIETPIRNGVLTGMRITYGGDEDELPTNKRDLPSDEEEVTGVASEAQDDERFRTVIRMEQPTLDLEDVELVSAELDVSAQILVEVTEPLPAREVETPAAPAPRPTLPLASAPTVPMPLPTAPPPRFVLQPAQLAPPPPRPAPAPIQRAPRKSRMGLAVAVLTLGFVLGAWLGIHLEAEAVTNVTTELLPGTAAAAPRLGHAPGGRSVVPSTPAAVSWQPSASNPTWAKR